MVQLIIEIPPLTDQDSYYLQERRKQSFNYPLHKHEALELNFVENCTGARRIVGDSMEVLGNYDLALVGSNIEHVWDQHECKTNDIHEITIQFMPDFLAESTLNRRFMQPLREMLENAKVGIAFDMRAIMTVYEKLNKLVTASKEPDFYAVNLMVEILYDLAASHGYHKLASTSYAHLDAPITSRRIQKIKEYIDKNYKNDVRLDDLAKLVNMTPNALSRFFKQRTNRSISDYFIEVRLGHATAMLVDSTMTVVEICYACGFNTISNFNRIFKSHKGLTPTEFRKNYTNNTVII